jgi:hypothetical protein
MALIFWGLPLELGQRADTCTAGMWGYCSCGAAYPLPASPAASPVMSS